MINTPPRIAECTTLASLYRAVSTEYADLPAIVPRDSKGYQDPISYAELFSRGVDLAHGLVNLGVTPHSQVAILADNRAEWLLCDFAILLAGAADVPRGTDSTDQEIVYIINHSDSCVVIVENENILERVLSRKRDLLRPNLPIIVMEHGADTILPEGAFSLDDVEAKGKQARDAGDNHIEVGIDRIQPDDLFTIIYTSGTTGTPKGVQLTHANMISQIKNIQFEEDEPCLKPSDRMLSILPIWHSYERVFEVLTLAYGASTYYTTIRTVGQDLPVAKPTCMASAPRLWESLYAKIMKSVESGSAIKRSMFHAAYACSKAFNESRFFLKGMALDTEGRSVFQNGILKLGHGIRLAVAAIPNAILDTIVLKKIRGAVGGQLRGTISGGGALPPHVDQFFNFIGIPVLEGYGLTETSPVIAVRQFCNIVIGSVGPLIRNTEIRVIDLDSGKTLYPDSSSPDGGRGLRGEIHVRGPQVMPGYYKDMVQTQKIIKDGWLNTGDIGMVTFNDCLKIIGRSKDTVVLLNGENLEPTPIEAKLQESALIDQCMVVGQDQKHIGALIVPAYQPLAERIGKADISPEELCKDPAAIKLMRSEVRLFVNASNGFKSHELIQGIALLPKVFVLGDEMTHTFKLKRHIIADKYQAEIEGIYQ